MLNEFLGRTLRSLRDWLYRGPNDRSFESRWLNYAKIALVLSLGTFVLSILIFLLSEETNRWQDRFPSITLSPTRWLLWKETENIACSSTDIDASCPRALWQSLKHRGSEKISSDKPFWLGYQLTAEECRLAFGAKANYLVLGWVRGDYSVFVQGQEIAEGKRTSHEPIIFPIPLSWLASPEGLRIAVRISPQPDVDNPDVFFKPFAERLASASEATASISGIAFYKKSRPFSLLTINLAFSAIFFLIWLSDREVREAFYLSLYSLLSATLQLRLSDIYLGQFAAATDYNLDFILRFYEGSLGLLLGMAFARIRREVFMTLAPIMVILPFIVLSLVTSPKDLRALAFSLENGFIPGCYVAGSLLCLLQRFGLDAQDSALRPRRQKLLIFSLGLLAIAALFPLERFFNFGLLRTFVWRISHLGIVAVMGHSAIRVYREQKQLLKKSPVSKYHRGELLVKEISGTLLSLDLKNSEELFQLGKLENEPGKFVSICMSRIWGVVDTAGGTVLMTDGDAIKVFFPHLSTAQAAISALLATERIAIELEQIARQLKSLHETRDWRIEFRAGLAPGQISPIWQDAGRSRFPTWVEGSASQPFLVSARLMELERKLEVKDGSVVLLPNELAIAVEATGRFGRTFAARDLSLTGKHDVTYVVSVWTPSSESSAVKLELAKSVS